MAMLVSGCQGETLGLIDCSRPSAAMCSFSCLSKHASNGGFNDRRSYEKTSYCLDTCTDLALCLCLCGSVYAVFPLDLIYVCVHGRS